MVAFSEARLDTAISLNFARSLDPARSILESASGYLQGVQHHQDPNAEYTFRYNSKTRLQLRDLNAFLFSIGQTAFRFKDHADFELTDELIATVAAASPLVVAYQIVKVYSVATSPPTTYSRNIIKPVAGTITLKIDDVPSASFSVDHTTGILTLTGSPLPISGGETLKVSGQFDVPVMAMDFGTQKYQRQSGTTRIHPTNIRLREFKIDSSI